jgi:hypothetical protein
VTINIFYEKFQSYINSLHIKKRSEYTIKDEMYLNILHVLKVKDSKQSAEFKFWVKELFVLVK